MTETENKSHSSQSKKGTRSNEPNKRKLLIQAAIAEFARRGYANTEVQAITDRCSLAKGTLYLYFKSKEKLFWDAFLYISRELEEIIHRISVSDAEPLDKISHIMIEAAQLFAEQPDYIPILAQMRSIPRAQVPTEINRLTDNALFGPLYGFIQAAIDQKQITPRRVEDFTTSLLNAMWGVMMFYRAEEDAMSLTERVRYTLELFMDGIKKR